MIKRIFTVIAIVAMFANTTVLIFAPQPARADTSGTIKNGIASFTGCFVGNIGANLLSGVANKLNDKVNSEVDKADTAITNAGINGLKKLGDKLHISFGGSAATNPTSAVGLGSVPVNVENASDIVDNINKGTTGAFSNYASTTNKNDILTRCLAWSILQAISNNALQIIRTGGPNGGTSFVANWRNFELGAQYRGENVFRAELSTTQLCNYFGNDVKQSYGVDPNQKTNLPPSDSTRVDSTQPYNLQAHCTLPSNFNLNDYNQNFAQNGGWNTYDQLLLPQNNPYGVGFLSESEMEKQRQVEQTADVNQVTANNGYLGISGCLVKDSHNNCVVQGNIKTPGSYLFQNVGQTVQAQFNWLTSAQGLNTILGNATEVLMKRMLNLSNNDEGNFYDASNYYEPEPITLPSTPTPDSGSGSATGAGGGDSGSSGGSGGDTSPQI